MSLHVVLVNNAYPPGLKSLAELRERCFPLSGWADGVRAAGAGVTVFQRWFRDETGCLENVNYRLVADRFGHRLRSWQVPRRLLRSIRHACAGDTRQATVVHWNGLVFPLPFRLLRQSLPAHVACVVQHHAEPPWPRWRRPFQRWAHQRADGYLFTSREVARPWTEAGMFRTRDVFEIMETSSVLRFRPRKASREVTGMDGDPVLFWSGNLTKNKDPLTILRGFERVLERFPAARLYMAYREEHLLDRVRQKIAASPALAKAVQLLGKIPYAQIGDYYNSADLFVQGSAKEGSGIAVLDGLACGVAPVVTDIPAFRTILRDGEVGRLWPVGNPDGFADAVRDTLRQPLASQSNRARSVFQQHWAFDCLGRQAVEIYREVARLRNGALLQP